MIAPTSRSRQSITVLALFAIISGLVYHASKYDYKTTLASPFLGSISKQVPSINPPRPSLHLEPTTISQAVATPYPIDTALPVSDITSTLVIARLSREDVSWVQQGLSNYATKVYVVDDSTAEFTVPKNKGHEAMVYLTYIIDHYDELPDVSIFIHAHRWTWHNNGLSDGDLVNMLSRFDLSWAYELGYVNLRCSQGPGCDHGQRLNAEEEDINKPEETIFKKVWSELHPLAPMPEYIAHPCCAQFAVSREVIRKHPREQYIKWRDWLLKTELTDRLSGRVWEYTWHYIFTGYAEVCLPTHYCYCQGYSICLKSYADSENYWLWYRERELLVWEYQVWKKSHNRTDSDEARKEAEGFDTRLEQMQQELDARRLEAIARGNSPLAKQKALSLTAYY